MRSLVKFTVLMVSFFAVSSQAFAAPHVERLARMRLADAGETEFVPVFSCATEGDRVKQIKFRISNQPARIDSVVIWFGNGTKQRLNLRQYFAQGSESAWKDLPGRARCVKFIKIKGEAIGAVLNTPAIIDIFGVVE